MEGCKTGMQIFTPMFCNRNHTDNIFYYLSGGLKTKALGSYQCFVYAFALIVEIAISYPRLTNILFAPCITSLFLIKLMLCFYMECSPFKSYILS